MKVTQVSKGDKGSDARTHYNEAMKTVEVNPTYLSGDGTTGNVLAVSESALITLIQNQINNMSTQDYFIEVAQGNISGASPLNKFGENVDIDTSSDPEDIWDVGGLWVAPTDARTHDIVSTSANDTSAGTGARTVFIQGLDSNWDLQSETITMNGTSNVATANTYRRIFRMFVQTAGSGGVNAGDISATAQTDSTVTAQINQDNGQTQMAIYTTPRNTTLYIYDYSAFFLGDPSAGFTTGATARLTLNAKPVDGDPSRTIKETFTLSADASSFVERTYLPPKAIGEKTDVWIRCENVTDSDTGISAAFDGILIDETVT